MTLAEALALGEEVLGQPQKRSQLLPLLEEDHAVYTGMRWGDIVDLRGWILAVLGRVGVDERALPFVLEELQSGEQAYLVAAAAFALRSFPQPRAAFLPFLQRAVTTIRDGDDAVSLDGFGAVVARPGTGTSAMLELATSFGWLAGHARSALPELRALASGPVSARVAERLRQSIGLIEAAAAPETGGSCCSAAQPAATAVPAARTRDPQALSGLAFEDHDGARLRFEEFFAGRLSVVVFFYTRCDNQQKCPLTMQKLARVQRMLAAEGLDSEVRTAAISYDPAYDIPVRLHSWGRLWELRMDSEHRLLRTLDDFARVQDYFGLRVNYSGALVNRHRIEAFILDRRARIARELTRLQWDEAALVAEVRALLAAEVE